MYEKWIDLDEFISNFNAEPDIIVKVTKNMVINLLKKDEIVVFGKTKFVNKNINLRNRLTNLINEKATNNSIRSKQLQAKKQITNDFIKIIVWFDKKKEHSQPLSQKIQDLKEIIIKYYRVQKENKPTDKSEIQITVTDIDTFFDQEELLTEKDFEDFAKVIDKKS